MSRLGVGAKTPIVWYGDRHNSYAIRGFWTDGFYQHAGASYVVEGGRERGDNVNEVEADTKLKFAAELGLKPAISAGRVRMPHCHFPHTHFGSLTPFHSVKCFCEVIYDDGCFQSTRVQHTRLLASISGTFLALKRDYPRILPVHHVSNSQQTRGSPTR